MKTVYKHMGCESCEGHESYVDRGNAKDEDFVQSLHMFFDNGYGLSIQRNSATYSSANTFEVAILHRTELDIERDDWRLCYRTSLTDDVLAHQSGEDIAKLVATVSTLPRWEWCGHSRTYP